MCKWGTTRMIRVIRRNHDDYPDGWHSIGVDACIANYVQEMNDRGIITVGCCCGHFDPIGASVLVDAASIPLLDRYGYSHHVFEPDRPDVVEHNFTPPG